MSSDKSHVTSYVALAISVLSLFATSYWNYRTLQIPVENDVRQKRQEALLKALRVIDHVYSNENLDPLKGPANPHPWDIQEARDAMNGMIIYCEDSKATLDTFKLTIGLYNPSIEKPKGINLKYLNAFRRQVARELNRGEISFDDSIAVWIAHLAGSDSAFLSKKPRTPILKQ